MELKFDTVLDEGRVDGVVEMPAVHGAERSFRTDRAGGPHLHVMADGDVMLESPKAGHMLDGFGENAEVLE